MHYRVIARLFPLLLSLHMYADPGQVHSLTSESSVITFSLPLASHESVCEDTIVLTVEEPGVELKEWHITSPSVESHTDVTHTIKKLYSPHADASGLDVQATLIHKNPLRDATVHALYVVHETKEPRQATATVHSERPQDSSTEAKGEHPTSPGVEKKFPQLKKSTSLSQRAFEALKNISTYVKAHVSGLLERSTSLWMRLLLVFLLGILMSLTPCIYPMIPVTVGLLQVSAQKSFVSNFLIATCYTLGIAITFSLLGLIVASGSARFGVLLSSPFFVIAVIGLLLYLAFSLFDFYPLYTPKFLKHPGRIKSSSAYVSAFIFGAASGTMISPCLSPGLALVLSLVAHLSNVWLGFLLLFAFGVGSSIPLLIVGTFTNTLSLMPSAGAWMDEIKKVFGLFLLASTYSYALIVFPEWFVFAAMAGLLAFLGHYYSKQSLHVTSTKIRRYRSVMSILLYAGACYAAFQAITPFTTPRTVSEVTWRTNFKDAETEALQDDKIMIIDFGASWCTLCHMVDRKIFNSSHVKEALKDVVSVKIDCSDPAADSCAPQLDQFNVQGFPTIVAYQPKDHTVLAQWQSELLDKGPESFVEEVRKLIP